MEELSWWRFIEDNDWEGETWYFYLLLTDYEAEYLDKLIDDNQSPYELYDCKFEENEIDVLVKYSEEGYMPQHNKIGRPPKDILKLSFEEVEEDDPFYKGQFWYK